MRRLAGLLLVGLAACGGSGGPRAVPTARPVEATAEAQLVLVPLRSWLHARVGDGMRTRAEERAHAHEDGALGDVFPARLLGFAGEWARVETLARTADDDCYGQPRALAGFRLRLFVRRAELPALTPVPVLAKQSDGTSVELAAGVAVRRLAPGRYRLAVDDALVELALPDRAVGQHYQRAFLDKQGEPTHELGEGAPVTLAGRTVSQSELSYTMARILREHGDEALIELGGSCAIYHVRVRREHLSPTGDAFGALVGAEYTPSLAVRPGAAITWPEGSPAGEAAEHAELRVGAELDPVSGRRCFSLSLGEEDLHLCFAPRDLSAARK